MIGRNLTRDDLQLVLHGNLPQQIANSYGNLPRQHPLAVLGAPHQVNFEVVLRVTAQALSSHNATSLTFPSPKGEGFESPKGTLK